MIGILDALGYLIFIGALFFPVVWFTGYFFTSLIRVLWQGQSPESKELEVVERREEPPRAA